VSETAVAAQSVRRNICSGLREGQSRTELQDACKRAWGGDKKQNCLWMWPSF